MTQSLSASKESGVSNKDLLELEKSESVLERRLLICPNGDDLSRREPPSITAIPESNVLGRLKSFLPTLDEANRKLFSDIQERGAEEFNIESVPDTEVRYVEMDLALGVADLNTPEALAAAELAANGQVLKVENSGGSPDHTTHSDGEEDNNTVGNDISEFLNGRRAKDSPQKSGSDDEDCRGDESQNKRKKIELLCVPNNKLASVRSIRQIGSKTTWYLPKIRRSNGNLVDHFFSIPKRKGFSGYGIVVAPLVKRIASS